MKTMEYKVLIINIYTSTIDPYFQISQRGDAKTSEPKKMIFGPGNHLEHMGTIYRTILWKPLILNTPLEYLIHSVLHSYSLLLRFLSNQKYRCGFGKTNFPKTTPRLVMIS